MNHRPGRDHSTRGLAPTNKDVTVTECDEILI
jgi:hypothetical protein